MPQVNNPLYLLNGGIASKLALGRIDLAKLRTTAEVQENLIPRVLGPASFRPGSEYLTRTYADGDPKFVPFIYNAATKALIEVTEFVARFLVDGQPVTRVAVSTAISNGTFASNIAGWTSADEAGASSFWSGGAMVLTGTGSSFSIRYQEVAVTDTTTEHAIRVVVTRGPIIFSVGTAAGLDDIQAETILRTGTHSIAVTPNVVAMFVQVKSDADTFRIIDSITIEGAGPLTIPHPWSTGYKDIRYVQSGDVMFVALDGIHQQRIERRSQTSWSIADYNTLDGPFRPVNTSATTMAPSVLTGAGTVTASRPFFKDGMAGALLRMTHAGQFQSATLTGDDQYTDSIRITGLAPQNHQDVSRNFAVIVTGLTGTGTTVTLQRSFVEEGNWVDVETYTANQNKTFNDNLDNQIIFYRLGITPGGYSTGAPDASLRSQGSQQGVVRLLQINSSTVADMEVITEPGLTETTTVWEEGEWSDYRGFPGSVAFHDGRLWWGWKDRVFGSVSDDFTSFDDNVIGDSGPVIRSVATGPIEGMLWLLSLQRLLAGTASQEVSMRSSSFDEPITPTQFTARDFANRGCANIQAVNVDGHALYVQRNGARVYAAGLDPSSSDYVSTDMTRIVPDLLAAGIVDIAVQRQPDTRVWFVLADGSVAVLVYEPADDVVAWITIVTEGNVKAVGILPGTDEDEVYIAVERENSEETIMAVEQFAELSECVGGALSKTVDSHVIWTGTTDTITGLDHLEGMNVKVWADGEPINNTFTVADGSISVNVTTSAVVGLAYDGRFKSSKLAVGASSGTAVSKQKRVDHVSLLMQDVSWAGIRVGRNFTDMTGIQPTLGNGRPLLVTEVLEDYDYNGAPFNGGWGPDERVCFKISSPYCATFMGLVIEQATNDAAVYGTRPTGG